ncbi:MAG TPA: transcription antitermination factor NusB [Candidatus Dormibacteraeota bacterium]|nr:transcription antitermination factor NusB [Candidatus Dormibacteraeota bacterium]
MKRTTAREKAMQILFQLEINDIDPVQAIDNHLGEEKSDKFLLMLVLGVEENKERIDNVIIQHLENWTIDRIASVERTVLRIATYEIIFVDSIPESVSINEGVELAKKYADEKSGKFVNGVLSKIIAEKDVVDDSSNH